MNRRIFLQQSSALGAASLLSLPNFSSAELPSQSLLVKQISP